MNGLESRTVNGRWSKPIRGHFDSFNCEWMTRENFCTKIERHTVTSCFQFYRSNWPPVRSGSTAKLKRRINTILCERNVEFLSFVVPYMERDIVDPKRPTRHSIFGQRKQKHIRRVFVDRIAAGSSHSLTLSFSPRLSLAHSICHCRQNRYTEPSPNSYEKIKTNWINDVIPFERMPMPRQRFDTVWRPRRRVNAVGGERWTVFSVNRGGRWMPAVALCVLCVATGNESIHGEYVNKKIKQQFAIHFQTIP